MSTITDKKITDGQRNAVWVQHQQDRLTGTPQQNKAVFDEYSELIRAHFNEAIDAIDERISTNDSDIEELKEINVSDAAESARESAEIASESAQTTQDMLGRVISISNKIYTKSWDVEQEQDEFVFSAEGYTYNESDTYEVFVNGLKLSESEYTRNEDSVVLGSSISAGNTVEIIVTTNLKGKGIADTELNDDYTLTINYDDGTSMTTESIRGEKGEKGDKGDGVYDDTEVKADIAVLESRVDSFTHLTEGSTTGDAELIDARIGADGTTYANAGDAIRGQVGDISETNKNLWTGNSSYTFVKSQVVQFGVTYPAGRYCISAVCTSTDTDVSVCRISIGGKSIDLARGTRASGYFDATSSFNSCTLLAAQNSSTSTGDTATWADIQLEVGAYPSDYVPHRLTAKDDTARAKINSLVKYVSTSGNDNNDGDTSNTAYKTIAKALSQTASVVYIAHGEYNEDISENTSYRYGSIKIVGDNVTVTTSGGCFAFRYCNVDMTGINVVVENALASNVSGFDLMNCTGKLTDCSADGAPYMAFKMDGSKLTLTRCIASNSGVDGFNGHTLVSGYDTECTFIDCIAHDNVDDGASIHEAGTMHIKGGKYYANGSTGIAFANQCGGSVSDAYICGNGAGIECFGSSGVDLAETVIIGNIIENNNTVGTVHASSDIGYGIHAKYYNVKALGNSVVDNNSGAYYEDTGSTITKYQVTNN